MNRFSQNVAVLLLLSGGVYSNAQDTGCIFANNGPATVSVQLTFSTESDGSGGDGGTGFIVSPSGYVITSAHVVKPKNDGGKIISSSITARVGGLASSAVPVTVSPDDIDESADIALIKLAPNVAKDDWPYLPISYIEKLSVGGHLIGLGFPSDGDLAIVPPGEKLSDTTIVDGKPKAWWTTSLALSHGDSGGPIFGQLGTVVGIAVAINRNSNSTTYVIPIAQAQSLLRKAKVQPHSFGSCADFPSCRNPSHGLEGYQIDQILTPGVSNWISGGGNPKANQDSWCSDYLGQLQNLYPNSSFTKINSSETQGWDNPIFRQGAKYQYSCTYRRLEGAIYKEQKSAACLK